MKRRTFLINGSALIPGLGFAQNLFAKSQATDKSLVVILLRGGLSHIDSFDPKPNAVENVRGEFKTIPTQTPGIHFSEMLPQLANNSNLFTLLRGVSHGIGIHNNAQRLILTGSSNPRANTPYLGAVVSHQFPSRSDVPVYAAIPALPPNAGELGQLHEPFNVLGDGGALLAKAPSQGDYEAWEQFTNRRNLLNALEQSTITPTPARIERKRAYQRAFSSLEAKPLRELTNIQNESSATLALYGEEDLGKYLLYARRLVELGSRCVTVEYGDWDTHSNAFPHLRKLLPILDHGLAGFLRDLADRNLLASTMVAVLTDFGRTPNISANAGRDHWPQCGVAILAGANFNAGQTWGETDELGMQVVSGNCTPQDIGCTLLEEMGIPTRTTHVPPTGRVLLPEGRRINEIIQVG